MDYLRQMRLPGAVLALAALLVLAGSSGAGIYVPPPPADAAPIWSPDASVIVFLSEREGTSLRVVNPDGSGERRIPWLPASPNFAFSPDWSHVAGPSSLATVVVERLDGSDRVDLGPATDGQKPSWSPDGTRLTYLVPGATPNRVDVAVARIDGSNVRRIVQGLSPSWSPTGELIAYLAGDYSHLRVHLIRPDGTGDRTLTTGPPSYGPPEWSPDGTRIAVVRRNFEADPYRSELEIWSIGGTLVESITLYGASLQFAWAPDGNAIAYSLGNGIFVVDLGSGASTLVSPFGSSPAWSPDGRELAFVGGGECRDRVGIYRVAVADRHPVRVTYGCRIVGTESDDVLSGTELGDVIAGLGGNDHLTAVSDYFAGDTIEGGDGNDVLVGSDRNDTLVGGAGDDVLRGGPSADVLRGGPGHDVLDGGGGRDVLYAIDGEPDVVACGTNATRSVGPESDIAYVDRIDRVSGCEWVYRLGPAPPVRGRTELTIRVWPKVILKPKSPHRTYSLRCHPTGGTLPHAAAACARLARIQNPFAPVPVAADCTWVSGGEKNAGVVGVYGGRKVAMNVGRWTLCGVRRWDQLQFLFPLP